MIDEYDRQSRELEPDYNDVPTSEGYEESHWRPGMTLREVREWERRWL